MEPSSNHIIRRALACERNALIALIEAGFGKKLSHELPHLVTEVRCPNHFVAEEDGKLIGIAGLYPYPITFRGTTFNAAGVGQVTTLPEARGRGAMSGILRAIAADANEFDFTWLYGDQQRYGRYGWTRAGRQFVTEFYDKYIPASPRFAEIQSLDFCRDRDLILAGIRALSPQVHMPDAEFDLVFATARDGNWTGWKLNDAVLIVEHHSTVIVASGSEEEITTLLSHGVREIRKVPGDHWKLTVFAPIEPSPLLRVCQKYSWHTSIGSTANLRVGRLSSFLEKACALAGPPPQSASGSLCLQAEEDGDSATVGWANGRFTVNPTASAPGIRLSRQSLSEICFGLWPLDLLIPDLPEDSPIRKMLPVGLHIPRVFAL